MTRLRPLFAAALIALVPAALHAQGAQIAFGKVKQDTQQPVEVTADNLSVNQNDGTAIFSGNVLIGQGAMRLSAPKVQVYYDEAGKRIQRMIATGGVTIVSGDDAAEASTAEYNIDGGSIQLRGDVLLVQGASAITSEQMDIDIESGTARMQGRVKTVLQSDE